MAINATPNDQEINPARLLRADIEVEEVVQQPENKAVIAVSTGHTTKPSLENKPSAQKTSTKRNLDDSKLGVKDILDLEQPDAHASKDATGLSHEEAAKAFETRGDYSDYFHLQCSTLSRTAFNAINVVNNEIVAPWWELDGEDAEIIEDHLTINVFGE